MTEHLLFLLDKTAKRKDTVIKGYDANQPVEITGEEAYARAEKIADFLKRKGIAKNDRVAVIAEKCPETIFSFFAIWLNAAIAVPVCETLKEKELNYILKDSGAKIVLCADCLQEKITSLPCAAHFSIHTFSSLKDYNVLSSFKDPSSREPDDAAFLIYTSGSTGNPKGVVLTHRNIFVNAVTGADYIRIENGDAITSILPYWHSFALAGEIFTILHVGGQIFIPKNKTTFLKDAVLFKPTIILSIPRFAQMLKRGIENLPKEHAKQAFGGRIKYFIGGGAPLDKGLQEFFLSIGIPMYQGYGLTEASPIISINAPHSSKIGTSGKMIPWLTKEHGGDYKFEEGELLVKGKCVMKGYWNLPEETKETLEDGWLRTGDMGYIDEDGFLMLSGRKKSLICLEGGEKFYPEFLEEHLKTSPYITQAMIIGEGCKRPSALINADEEKVKNLSEDEIIKIVATEIKELTKDFEPYQIPASFLVLPAFSVENDLLTNTQKLRRHKVLEKYRDKIRDLVK